MKNLKLLTLLACLALIFTACNDKETDALGDPAPTVAAWVDGCEVAGPYSTGFDNWRPDWNQVMNDCYREAPDPGCTQTSETQQVTKELLAFHLGCNYSAATVNQVLQSMVTWAQTSQSQGGGRPLSTYSNNGQNINSRTRCDWYITNFYTVYSNSAGRFVLKVTYKKECCKEILVQTSHDVHNYVIDMPGDPMDPKPYRLEIYANETYTGPGFVVGLFDAAGSPLESSQTERDPVTNNYVTYLSEEVLLHTDLIVMDN